MQRWFLAALEQFRSQRENGKEWSGWWGGTRLTESLRLPTITIPLTQSRQAPSPPPSICILVVFSVRLSSSLLIIKHNPSYSLWLVPAQWVVLEGKVEGRLITWLVGNTYPLVSSWTFLVGGGWGKIERRDIV